ncbi:MAG: hypothetical protein F4X92_00635 [Gammaproteobacteria bacterium]|nr:hypothetical protein [Gammaproteobacteria bacterium]
MTGISILLFTVGTGGAMTAECLEKVNSCVYTPLIRVEHAPRKIDARTTAEQIMAIKSAFALNLSELATVFGASRPTVYAWLNGQEPKPESTRKIHHALNLAEQLQALDIPRMDKVVRRPVFGSQSMVDRLKEGEVSREDLITLKSLAEKEAQSRYLTKGSGKVRESFSDASDGFSSFV